jgi:CheY-like chemotaxis protein
MVATSFATGPTISNPIPRPTSPDTRLQALSRVRETANSISNRVRDALTPVGFRPMRVLVVDDHPDAADSLAAVVEMLGCPVWACHSGRAALTAAGGFNPEVCLIDLKMPEMDGFELAARLKTRAAGRPPVVVATTALAYEESRERTKQAGFHLHLKKPIEPAILIAALAELSKTLAPIGDDDTP